MIVDKYKLGIGAGAYFTWELTRGDKISHNKVQIKTCVEELLKQGHRSEFFGIDPETSLIVSTGGDALAGDEPLITVRKRSDGFYIAKIRNEDRKIKLDSVPELIQLALDSLNDTVNARLASDVKK